MASWHPHDEAWSGVERREVAKDNGYSRCTCGRQYDTLLHEQLGVCESCDIEEEAN